MQTALQAMDWHGVPLIALLAVHAHMILLRNRSVPMRYVCHRGMTLVYLLVLQTISAAAPLPQANFIIGCWI